MYISGLMTAGCALSDWGTEYYVYIIAENTYGVFETDYASVPVFVDAP